MLVIILGLTLSVLDSTLVNLALPAMARELQASSAHTLWVVNSYQLASLVLLLPLAALGERLGYRRVYLVGMLVFSLASLAAILATSLPTLVAARALQGLGAAGVMSVNAALVRLIYPRALLGRGMAVNSLVVATASMAGPSVAAAILSVASWPWLFAANLPLGLFTLWLGRRALPANAVPAHAGARLSPLDVLLNILMFSLIFLGFFSCGYQLAFITAHFPAFVTEMCGPIDPNGPLAALGISSTSALGAVAIAVIGLANIAGTLTAGWLGKRYGYLLPAILLHVLNNAVAVWLSLP